MTEPNINKSKTDCNKIKNFNNENEIHGDRTMNDVSKSLYCKI